jgi:hypothetical protein
MNPPKKKPDDGGVNIAPASDNNVMKVTEDCLFVRTVYGCMFGGRSSMSWWGTVMSVFVWAYFVGCGYGVYSHTVAGGKYYGSFFDFTLDNWPYTFLIPFLFFLAMFWMFIPWRLQLPIIFNRKTMKVSCHIKGRTLTQDWKQLNARIHDVTSPVYGGAPVNEGALRLMFPCPETNRLELESVYATTDADIARTVRGIVGAAMIWAYICLYMEKGMAALPPSDPGVPKYRFKSVRELFKAFNPIPIIPKRSNYLPISLPFFLFLELPGIPLVILGDLIYLGLDCILPRRKWPKGLLEACDYVWDGSNDYGPRSDDALVATAAASSESVAILPVMVGLIGECLLIAGLIFGDNIIFNTMNYWHTTLDEKFRGYSIVGYDPQLVDTNWHTWFQTDSLDVTIVFPLPGHQHTLSNMRTGKILSADILSSGGCMIIYKYENLEDVKEYPLTVSYVPDDPAHGKRLEATFVVKKE